jgi:chromosome segregation ATPase
LNNEIDANLKRALDQRDRAIEQLSVQTEIALDNNAERQIAEARQMQLNFENKLVALQLKFDESLNEVGTNLKRALDHAIGQLNQRFEVEIGLGKKLARAEREISAARERQPNFEVELVSLREQNANQQKLITRLRGQVSQLEFSQQQLDSEQQHSRQQLKVTSIEVSNVGNATRAALEALRESGVDLWETESPGGLVS